MRIQRLALLVTAGASLTACSLDNLLNGEAPPQGGIIDPSKITNAAGAIQLYHAAIGAMADGMGSVSKDIGVFTD